LRAGKKAAPQDEALALAQQRAALPIEQGGLGLPPTNTEMDRSKAMGFDTDVYHATGADFPKFDLKKAGSATTITKGEKAVFSSTKPSVSNEFIAGPFYQKDGQILRHYDEGSNIIPLKARAGQLDIHDMFGATYDAPYVQQALKDAKKDKMDNVVFRQMKDPGFTTLGSGEKSNILATMNPDMLRSRFAAFDPWRKTAATAAAFGVAAPNLLAEELRKK
jgi:hypothetical protein